MSMARLVVRDHHQSEIGARLAGHLHRLHIRIHLGHGIHVGGRRSARFGGHGVLRMILRKRWNSHKHGKRDGKNDLFHLETSYRFDCVRSAWPRH
jgi:hypothetical protein